MITNNIFKGLLLSPLYPARAGVSFGRYMRGIYNKKTPLFKDKQPWKASGFSALAAAGLTILSPVSLFSAGGALAFGAGSLTFGTVGGYFSSNRNSTKDEDYSQSIIIEDVSTLAVELEEKIEENLGDQFEKSINNICLYLTSIEKLNQEKKPFSDKNGNFDGLKTLKFLETVGEVNNVFAVRLMYLSVCKICQNYNPLPSKLKQIRDYLECAYNVDRYIVTHNSTKIKEDQKISSKEAILEDIKKSEHIPLHYNENPNGGGNSHCIGLRISRGKNASDRSYTTITECDPLKDRDFKYTISHVLNDERLDEIITQTIEERKRPDVLNGLAYQEIKDKTIQRSNDCSFYAQLRAMPEEWLSFDGKDKLSLYETIKNITNST